jgi:hypothetical protein
LGLCLAFSSDGKTLATSSANPSYANEPKNANRIRTYVDFS